MQNKPKTNHRLIYVAWYNMKMRCEGRFERSRKSYIEKGITYDERWSSFQNFKEDMGKTYVKGLTLDRIDNDKGYSKENCRWATQKEQQNNKSNNRMITIDGVTKNLTQWIEFYGQKDCVVRSRYYTSHWPIREALGIDRKTG